MRLLLDTHILLWALADDPRLGLRHREMLNGAAELYLSAASVWEISIKRSLGKLKAPDELIETARQAGCRPLTITWAHADAAGALPAHHADPFDRLLIAQAQIEAMTLVTADRAFASYGVRVV